MKRALYIATFKCTPGWLKLLSYLHCQAAAQNEVAQSSSRDLTGGKSWRKWFLETAQGS